MAHLAESRNRGLYCEASTGAGVSCRAYRLRDDIFCYVHSPRTKHQNEARLKEVSVVGIRKSAETRARRRRLAEERYAEPNPWVLKRVPRIESPRHLREYLAEVLPLAAGGALGPARDKVFVALAKLVARTFEMEAGIALPPVFPGLEGEMESPTHAGPSPGRDPHANDEDDLDGLPPDGMLLGDLDLGDDNPLPEESPEDQGQLCVADPGPGAGETPFPTPQDGTQGDPPGGHA